VLAHGVVYNAASWRPQAEAISEAGATVLALEETSPGAILAGIEYLTDIRCARSDPGFSAQSQVVNHLVAGQQPGETAAVEDRKL